ncbi:MAG: hypothetical protein ACI92A_002005 [Candidatus Paceibacteria bacterium]|jgi:hypothetical protein
MVNGPVGPHIGKCDRPQNESEAETLARYSGGLGRGQGLGGISLRCCASRAIGVPRGGELDFCRSVYPNQTRKTYRLSKRQQIAAPEGGTAIAGRPSGLAPSLEISPACPLPSLQVPSDCRL